MSPVLATLINGAEPLFRSTKHWSNGFSSARAALAAAPPRTTLGKLGKLPPYTQVLINETTYFGAAAALES